MVGRFVAIGEIVHGQPGAILHTLQQEAALGFHLLEEPLNPKQFLQNHSGFAFLRASEIVQAHDFHAGVFLPAANDVQNFPGIHAELAAASQPQQNRYPNSSLLGAGIQQVHVHTALGGKGAHPVVHGPLDIRQSFVYAGKNDRRGIRSDSFTNGQFTGAAHLDPVDGFGKAAQKEGIGFHGKTQSHLLAESLPHPSGAADKAIFVKNITRTGR